MDDRFDRRELLLQLNWQEEAKDSFRWKRDHPPGKLRRRAFRTGQVLPGTLLFPQASRLGSDRHLAIHAPFPLSQR
jgi:hypothetical protein